MTQKKLHQSDQELTMLVPKWSASAANLDHVEASIYSIDEKITKPGAVRINVTGAFIVDDGTVTPQVMEDDGAVHDTRDIRLPHHTAVVSHVAVDVRLTILEVVLRTDHSRYRLEAPLQNWSTFPESRIRKSLEGVSTFSSSRRIG